ncbi:hypothetical protein PGTUg99_026759 [Puccinia graminis f. sp. tritici]|uniref:Uncharacterized protein n=1 Tax=Puccinia graminis f. sp. tritici TaxID=56615 RepID=A0A5B0NK54_PUCGR|nr:hypothetical protein PGTUg99_026759 [Puccinia graminis f. sp. tritici]
MEEGVHRRGKNLIIGISSELGSGSLVDVGIGRWDFPVNNKWLQFQAPHHPGASPRPPHPPSRLPPSTTSF